MSRIDRIVALAACLTFATGAFAGSEWNLNEFDLYPGDFNADGKTDILYVAKDDNGRSGIALADASGNPSQLHQDWGSAGFGIAWHSNLYRPIVADFTGDGRSDVLMQRHSPGDHYLLVTGTDGKLSGTLQTIPNVLDGIDFSGSAHRIVAGKFNTGANYDLFLQATTASGVNAVFLANGSGQFSTKHQTWGDLHLNVRWSLPNALVHAGDFNADGLDDLLVQAKPSTVIIDFDVPFPVPVYRPGSFGIVWARSEAAPGIFRGNALSDLDQHWDRNYLGLDWSAKESEIILGYFDGAAGIDILLQSRKSGRDNVLVLTNPSSHFAATTQVISSSTIRTASTDQYRLHSGRWGNQTSSGLYLQATSSYGTSYVGLNVASSGSLTAHYPFFTSIPVAGTAVGAIGGDFTVDPSGAATYRIPIDVPPGIAGMRPELALQYSSQAGNGLLGVGWNLTGLSSLARCGMTWESDGFTDGVDFDDRDAYCLDGARLKATSGSNGAVGAVYATERQSFQRVESVGGSANNPDYFIVRDKAGLIRYYGNTTDSRILLQGTASRAFIWALKRIEDRHGNFVEVEYAYTSADSSHRPTEVRWGRGPQSGTRNVVGRVHFEYSSGRPDPTSGYLAGYVIGNNYLLRSIDVYSRPSSTATATEATRAVASYYLAYEQTPVSNASLIKQIVKCDGGETGVRKCLAATKFQWQYGQRGYFGSLIGGTTADRENHKGMRVLDLNNDGRSDYLYNYGSSNRWGYHLNGLGGAAVQTTFTTFSGAQDVVVVDWNADSYPDILQRANNNTYNVIYGGQTGFTSQSSTTITAKALEQGYGGMHTSVGDFDGDGRQDLAYFSGDWIYEGGPLVNWNLTVHRSGTNGFTAETSANTSSINTGGFPLNDETNVEFAFQPGSTQAGLVINFDGDGRDDILVRVGTGCYNLDYNVGCTGTRIKVFSFDVATQSLVQVWERVVGSSFPDMSFWKAADFNGDGLTDILSWDGSSWRVRVGTGSATEGLKSVWVSNSVTMPVTNDTPSLFNNPGPVPPTGTATHSLTKAKAQYALIADYDRDGNSDVIFAGATSNSNWLVIPGDPATGLRNVSYDTGVMTGTKEAGLIADDRGDGVTDLISIWGNTAGSDYSVSRSRATMSPTLITRITDGFGALTDIQYSPVSVNLVNGTNSFYEGHVDFLDSLPPAGTTPAFPYQHYVAPITVVTQIAQDNGIGAVSAANGASNYVHTRYKYAGMKAHRQGRGLLGFARVTAQNANTNIWTVNEFAQRFPYTGSIVRAEQRFGDAEVVMQVDPDLILQYQSSCESQENCPSLNPTYTVTMPGPKLTETVNELSYMSWSTGGLVMPYVRVSTETRYQFVSNAPVTADIPKISRKITEHLDASGGTAGNRFDNYGNPYYVRVSVDNGRGGDSHVTSTSNTYDNLTGDANSDGAEDWCLGRLRSTTVTHTKGTMSSGNPGASTITRRSEFTYRPAPRCDLETETQDVNSVATSYQSGSAVSVSLAKTTTHGYDSFGNKNQSSISVAYPAGTPARVVTTNYDATQGQFATLVTNGLNHTQTSTWDPRFGFKLTDTGPNGVTSSNEPDGFGRLVRSTPMSAVQGASALPGLNSAVKFYWCADAGLCADSRSVLATRTTKSDGGQVWMEYDRLNRETLKAEIGVDGRWLYQQTHFDHLGRAYAKSQPFFAPSGVANANKCWTISKFDMLSRLKTVETNYVNSSGGDSCSPSPPSPGVSLTGSVRKTEFTYDLISGDWTGTKAQANADDPDARRTSYKLVDVLGKTKVVTEELVAGACAGGSGSANCPLVEYDQDAQGNTTLLRRSGDLAAGSATLVAATIETKVYFDARGFKRRIEDPDMGVWDYDYNGHGEQTWQRDARGLETWFGYDVLGRLTSRTEEGEGTSYFYFDETAANLGGPRAVGKPTRTTQPGGFEERLRYDDLGRLASTKRRIDGSWHWIDQTYDGQSRVDLMKYPAWTSASTESAPAPDSQRLIVRNVYNSYGHLTETFNVTTGKTEWKVSEVGQYGVTKQTLGNGVVVDKEFEAATGRITRVVAQKPGIGLAQDMRFGYDRADNLRRRADYAPGVNRSETLGYDDLSRLTSTASFANAESTGTSTSESYSYDVFGNIRSKGASGALFDQFDYRGSSGCAPTGTPCRQGAVKSVRVNGGTTRTLGYDANGSVISQVGGSFTGIEWTVANRARRITKGAEYAEFSYAPDRSRFKQVAVRTTGTETTIYVGGLVEIFTKGSASQATYYISGGGGVVSIYKHTFNSGVLTTTEQRYLHRDHLGSVVVMTDAAGSAVERVNFDAWGKRRTATTWAASAPGVLVAGPAFSTRGFTGHEHVDFTSIVHMNGRIYDPELGRFLSADPNVAYPETTQGFNRYSYVDNAPLSFTDPSGFRKSGGLLQYFIAWVMAYATSGATLMGTTGASTIGGAYAQATVGQMAGAAFVGGFTSGFVSSGGDLRAALSSGIGGALTAGIGHGIGNYNNARPWSVQALAKAVTHGALQGVLAEALGGSYKSAFLGGFFSSYVGEGISSSIGAQGFGEVVVSAVIGGTAAAIGGGKFANGASSGAFVALFNQVFSGQFGDFTNVAPEALAELRQKYPEITEWEDKIWKDSFKRYFKGRGGLRDERMENAFIVYQNIQSGSIYPRFFTAKMRDGVYDAVDLPPGFDIPFGYRVILIEHTHPFPWETASVMSIMFKTAGRGPSQKDANLARMHPEVIFVIQAWSEQHNIAREFLYYGPGAGMN